jgi:hypothetical protein
MMRQIKGFILIVIILMCLEVLDNRRYNKMAKEDIEKGKELAINCIREKYGIEAEFISGLSDIRFHANSMVFIPFFGGKYVSRGSVYIKLRYKDENFIVQTNINESQSLCYDNRQFEEIKRDFAKYVEQVFPLDEYKFNVSYGNSTKINGEYYTSGEFSTSGLINTLYTKDNLKDVISGFYFSIVIDTHNNNKLGKVNNNDIKPLMDILEKATDYSIDIYNYRSKEDMIDSRGDILYLQSSIEIKDGELKHNVYNINYYDDIKYIVINPEKNFSIERANFNISKSQLKYEGKIKYDYEIFSKVYSVKYEEGQTAFLYYPISKIKNIKKYDDSGYRAYIGIVYLNEQNNVRTQLSGKKMDDYYVFRIISSHKDREENIMIAGWKEK